jgi:uncharacterized protein (TIGR00369 family)
MTGLRERVDAILAGKERPPPVSVTFGMNLIECKRGKAALTMKVGKKFYNPMGTVHGGVITVLADAAMGIATIGTLREGEAFTTLELKMNFLRPIYEDQLRADGMVVHRGRTIVLAHVVVKNSARKVVARGTATKLILRPKERAE